MGSGSSVPRCPKNFNKTDFSAILGLYDALDSNGDFLVESKEVTQIADIHVSNKIKEAQRQVVFALRKKTLMTEDVRRHLNNEISAIKSACHLKICRVTAQREGVLKADQKRIDARVGDLRSEIKQYEVASPHEKQEMFMSAVSPGKITFKEFFKYMRVRTNNLRHVYPQLYEA
jgi:hypothetical protein